MCSSPNIVKTKKNEYAFGDALVMTGFGKFNILLTALCGVMAIGLILETVSFGFIISSAHCDLNLTLTDRGLLGAMPLIGLTSSSQIWGYIADTRGRRKVLIISLFFSSVCAMLNSLSPNLMSMLILKFLSSAIVSATNAVIFAYFGEMTPKTHVDMMISVLCSVFGAGSIVGTGIAWGILSLDFNIPLPLIGITYRPWRLLSIGYALVLTLASFGMYLAPESPKYLMSKGRKEEVMQTLKRIYTMNTGKDASTYLVDELLIDEQDNIENSNKDKSVLCSIWSQVVPIFKPPLLLYSLIAFTLAFGVIGSVNPFFMWLPEIMRRFYEAIDNGNTEGKTFCELLTTGKETGNNLLLNDTMESEMCDDTFNSNLYPLMLLVNSFLTLANIVVAIILNWVQKRQILTTLFTMSCLGIVLIHFVPNMYGAWFLLLIYQCCGSSLGIVTAYMMELFPTQYRAMAMSFMLMFGRIGGIIGTNIMGLLIENNCTLNFSLNAAVLTLCTLVCFMLPSPNTEKKKIDTMTC